MALKAKQTKYLVVCLGHFILKGQLCICHIYPKFRGNFVDSAEYLIIQGSKYCKYYCMYIMAQLLVLVVPFDLSFMIVTYKIIYLRFVTRYNVFI